MSIHNSGIYTLYSPIIVCITPGNIMLVNLTRYSKVMNYSLEHIPYHGKHENIDKYPFIDLYSTTFVGRGQDWLNYYLTMADILSVFSERLSVEPVGTCCSVRNVLICLSSLEPSWRG